MPYLDEWEESVSRREGFSSAEKSQMILSTETLLGLRMTGIIISMYNIHCLTTSLHNICHIYTCHCFVTAKSFVGLVRYLFSLPDIKDNRLAFLSNNICQDPLENFFGAQRQRGSSSDNPSAYEFYKNTAALRVVNSFCRGPLTGNCRGGKPAEDLLSDKENTPLQRRR